MKDGLHVLGRHSLSPYRGEVEPLYNLQEKGGGFQRQRGRKEKKNVVAQKRRGKRKTVLSKENPLPRKHQRRKSLEKHKGWCSGASIELSFWVFRKRKRGAELKEGGAPASFSEKSL